MLQLGMRAFALACRRVAGDLELEARAESVADHGFALRIVVTSPEIAAALKVLGAALLAELNFELSKVTGPKRQNRRTRIRPLRKLMFRVGSAEQIAALPSYADWKAARPAAPAFRRPRPVRDARVDEAVAQVHDPALRELLDSWYSRAAEQPAEAAAPVSAPKSKPAPKRGSDATPQDPASAFAIAQSVLATLDRRRFEASSEGRQ